MMGPMRHDAVIFDLFGTLVDNMTPARFGGMLMAMATHVGADPVAFQRTWCNDPELIENRMTGRDGSPEACVRAVCRRLGMTPSDQAIQQAGRIRVAHQRDVVVPRPDAVDTLRTLRERGLKIGLMSDCSREIEDLWKRTELSALVDVPLLSAVVGMHKPQPEFYALACERLGVSPGRTLYVGDGASDELRGARQAGMEAVLICTPREEKIVLVRPSVRNWRGRRIRSLSEVLDIVGEPE